MEQLQREGFLCTLNCSTTVKVLFQKRYSADPDGSHTSIMAFVAHPAYQVNGFSGKLTNLFIEK